MKENCWRLNSFEICFLFWLQSTVYTYKNTPLYNCTFPWMKTNTKAHNKPKTHQIFISEKGNLNKYASIVATWLLQHHLDANFHILNIKVVVPHWIQYIFFFKKKCWWFLIEFRRSGDIQSSKEWRCEVVFAMSTNSHFVYKWE